MSSYDPADFARNPKKYALFRTATVSRAILTHNGADDLAAGEVVGISHLCTARNQLYRRDEPVYTVTTTNGRVWGSVYANALADFVL